MPRPRINISLPRPAAGNAGGGSGGGDGATGPTGPSGLSAYEIAVIEGFSGTEQEWLASLVGQDGPTGPQGAIGPTGSAGQNGATGPQGATGPAGAQGVQGIDGAAVTVSATTPESAEEGDFWFDSSKAELYVFYDGFWVEASSSEAGPIGPAGPTGATGPQGSIGPTGATGADSTVTGPTGSTGATGPAGEDGQFTFVSDAVPENATEGDSWFNSSNGQIYIYYDGFWIESASSNIGPAGPTGPEGGVDIVEAPASPTSSGTPGDVAFDADYIYICTAPNTWVRANRETW